MTLSRSDLRRALEHLQAKDWQAAHEIVQQDEDSPLACWGHGIVHIMEGDLSNARYWYKQAKRAFPDKPDPQAETEALARALKEKN